MDICFANIWPSPFLSPPISALGSPAPPLDPIIHHMVLYHSNAVTKSSLRTIVSWCVENNISLIEIAYSPTLLQNTCTITAILGCTHSVSALSSSE